MADALVYIERHILYDLRCAKGRSLDWYDLAIITMHNQSGTIDRFWVSGIVNLREFPDTVMLSLNTTGHTLQPETVSEAGVVFETFASEAIER